MLDDAYEQRNRHAIKLALEHPKWGLHKIARETNKVYGGKNAPMNHRHVSAALAAAGVVKVNGKWQHN